MVLSLAVPVLIQAWVTGFGSGGDVVSGHPKRLPVQWLVTGLPQRPGPIAGLLQRHSEDGFSWQAISATGTRWRITDVHRQNDFYPVLSADGRNLGYLTDGKGFVMRDLVEGKEVRFPQIGDNNIGMGREEVRLYSQSPGFWSPDGTRVVLPGFRDGPRKAATLVLGRDGTIVDLRLQPAHSYLIGWAGNDQVAWLTAGYGEGFDGTSPPRTVQLRITDVQGREQTTTPLVPNGSWDEVFNQWTGSLSPEGDVVAVAAGERDNRRVRLFDARTGLEISRTKSVSRPMGWCPISWHGRSPVVLARMGDPFDDRSQLDTVDAGADTVLAAAQPELEAGCVYWADAALSGTAYGLAPASWGGWLVWWWRECLLGALLLGAVIFLLRRRASR